MRHMFRFQGVEVSQGQKISEVDFLQKTNKNSFLILPLSKGELTSKCHFGVSVLTKEPEPMEYS